MSYESSVSENQTYSTILFPLWSICLFVVTMLFVAWLLFPSKTLSRQVLASDAPQEITLFYLEQLVKLEPTVSSYHAALAQQYIWKGDWALASQQIDQLVVDPSYAVPIKLLRFEIALGQAFQKKEKAEREQDFVKLRQELKELVQLPLNQSQQLAMGKIALGLDAPDIALKIYEQIASNDKTHDPRLYRKIASVALQTQQYAISATYYFKAMDFEQQVEQKRQDLVDALSVLQQGGIASQGVNFVVSLPDKITNNKVLLEYLTEFMLAAGRPDLAQLYIKRALLMGVLLQ